MTPSRFAAAQWLFFAVAAAVLLYLLGPVHAPFVAAGILAYICSPLVQRPSVREIPRAVALVMGGFLLLALPLSAVSLVALRRCKAAYPASSMYRKT